METNVEKRKGNKFPVFQMRFHKLRGGMSQEEFAKKIGVSRPVIGFYENGERVPDALTLKKIAEKCNTSVDWLLGLTDVEDGNADDVAIEKRLGLLGKSIKKLREIKNECDNVQFEREAILSGQLAPEKCQHLGKSKIEQILEAVNMLLSVDKMEDFFWPVSLFMWRMFDKDAVIDVRDYPVGSEKIILTPGQLEKILLLDIQDFMVAARGKIAAEHDAGVDDYTETLLRGDKA